MDMSRSSLSVGIFTGFLQYFPKNRAILVQKLGEESKLSKCVSGYFMTKKNPTACKLGGGGEDLNGITIKKLTYYFYYFFFWRP